MTLPRDVVPGRYYLITRRTAQRQFLLRPDNEVNNAFAYCLGEAARRFEIDVMLSLAMSNHHHTVIFDRHGNYPAFIEHFHKMLARCLNAYRGRWENFWSTHQCSVVRLVKVADILDKLAYVATNPVKDDLVNDVHEWPGFSGYAAFVSQAPIIATRPAFFFKAHGTMPETIELRMVVPPELGDAAGIIRNLQGRVQLAVDAARQLRRASRKRVLGAHGVRVQPWDARPSSVEPRRELSPRIAARDKWTRLEALLRNKEFLAAYQVARRELVTGIVVPFPVGTYWLRRYANVPIAA